MNSMNFPRKLAPGNPKGVISMKRSVLPATFRGKLSVVLFAGFLILGLAANVISRETSNTIEYPNPINSPLLGSVLYLAFGSIIASAAIGILAIRKDQEPSWLVRLLIPFGSSFFVILVIFFIANLIGPPN